MRKNLGETVRTASKATALNRQRMRTTTITAATSLIKLIIAAG